MLNKLIVRKLYSQGLNYAEIAFKFSVSRQRIHQIIKKYCTIGGKLSSVGRPALLQANCFICGKKREVIHHIDGNSHNNINENLMPLCRKCHVGVHCGRIKIEIKNEEKSKCKYCRRNGCFAFLFKTRHEENVIGY